MVPKMCCSDTDSTSVANISGSLQSRTLSNCPDNTMTLQTFNAVDRSVSCGLVPSFFLIGAPANILSMIIFYRQGLRDRMNLCLFCLAFTDLIYVTSFFISSSFCLIGIFLPGKEQFWRWILVVNTLNLVYGFAYSSSSLTMIISVERCVCVMFPMKAATLISTKTMAIILLLTLSFIHFLCGVYVIKEKIVMVKDDITGEYLSVPVHTDLYLNFSVFRIIENIVLSCISVSNFIFVLVATLITVLRLHTAQTWRKATSSHMKGQGMLMRMLVAMSCVYILCAAPDFFLALARLTISEFRADGDYCLIFFTLHMFRHVVYMLQSSINFFVYLIMSSRFRQELTIFCLCTKPALSSKASIKSSNTTTKCL